MPTLEFSVRINAPKKKVWHTMLDDATFRVWTAEFMPDGYFVGDWSEGSKMLFLAPGENGEAGMVSRIRANRPYEHISIEHVGIVENGEEDTTSEAARTWAGFEKYFFEEVDGKTEVLVEMDSSEEGREMLETAWPKALAKLKELAEE